MIVHINKQKILQYLMLLLLLYWHDSGLKFIIGRDTFDTFVIFICIFVLFIRKKQLSKTAFAFIFCITLNIVLVRLLSGGVGLQILLHFTSAILVCYSAYEIDKEKFIQRFVKLVIFYSIISLLMWGITLINRQLFQNFTLLSYVPYYDKIYSSALNYELTPVEYFGGIFYVLRNEISRNTGIFNEPGLYSIVVSIALILVLFYPEQISKSPKKISRYTIILLVTIITIQSTTGFLSVICIVCGYIFSKNLNYKLRFKFIGLVITIIIFLGVDFVFNQMDSLLGTIILSKISITSNGISLIGTGSARASTIEIVLENLGNHLFGIGYDKTYNLLNMYGKDSADGAALVSDLMALGIQWGIILFYFVIMQAYKHKINILCFVIFVLIYINITLGQSDVLYPSLLILTLPLYRKEKYVNENSLAMQCPYKKNLFNAKY